MSERIDVFISSTARDLAIYRDLVAKTVLRLGMFPIDMANFNPTDRNALQLCYDKVQEAEIFIGIYAHRYGYAPSPDITYVTKDGSLLRGDGETSITNFEYKWAIERNLPMILCVISETNTDGKPLEWPVAFIEDEPGKSRLKAFKNSIMSNHVVGFFSSADNLASQVAIALTSELLNRSKITIKPSIPRTGVRIVGERIADISSYFRDRHNQRNELSTLLSEDTTKLISVIGRGGIGKTAVVSQVLTEIVDQTWHLTAARPPIDGIAYLSTRTRGISLERIFLDCADLVDATAKNAILGLLTNPNLKVNEKITRFLELLSDRNYIILLDNFEDLLDDRQEIKDPDLKTFLEISLRFPHHTSLLITTRQPILLHNDLLRFDKRVLLQEGLPEDDAVSVLRDLDPHGAYGLRDAKEDKLRKITRKVHGIPRALEIVASILASDPFTDIDDLLAHESIFAHEEFIELLVHANYERLNQTSRYVLEALSVFRRPMPLYAIQSLLKDFLPSMEVQFTLSQLIQRHSISFDRTTKLVSLHPIDSDYIYNRIPLNGLYNRRLLDAKAAEYYAQIGVPRNRWNEYNDLDAKLQECQHLIRAGEFEKAFTEIPYDVLYSWGYYDRLLKLYEPLIDNLTNLQVQQRFLSNFANLYRRVGETIKAIDLYEKALAIIRENSFEGESNHLAWLAHCYFEIVDIKRARDNYEKALQLDEEKGSQQSVSWRLRSLGWCIKHVGEINQAFNYVNTALQIAKSIEDSTNDQATALFTLAQLCLDIGNLTQAETYLSEALTLFESSRETVWVMYVRLIIADFLIQTGKVEKALLELFKLRKDTEFTDDVYVNFHICEKMARAYFNQGNMVEAQAMAQKGLQYNFPRENHTLLALAGVIELSLENTAEAHAIFRKGFQTAKQILSRNQGYYSALSSLIVVICGLIICGDNDNEADGIKARDEFLEIVIRNKATGIYNSVNSILRHVMTLDHNSGAVDIYKKIIDTNLKFN